MAIPLSDWQLRVAAQKLCTVLAFSLASLNSGLISLFRCPALRLDLYVKSDKLDRKGMNRPSKIGHRSSRLLDHGCLQKQINFKIFNALNVYLISIIYELKLHF